MRRLIHDSLFLALASTLVFSGSVSLTAQTPPRTISVTGSGTAAAAPDYMQVNFTMAGAGEKLTEARDAFSELKAKVQAKIDGFDDLDIIADYQGEQQGDGSGSNAALNAMMGEAPGGGSFSVSESVSLRFEFDGDMERLEMSQSVSKVIDGLAEAGINFGSASTMSRLVNSKGLIEFGIADSQELELRVAESAMQDARRRAENIAKLAGGRLGQVLSIEETPSESAYGPQAGLMAIYGLALKNASSTAGMTSAVNCDLELSGKLTVVFELID
jgi:uncharacterized protein YggE